jgi:transposase
MDGFTGDKTAAVEAIDTVVTVMDPFHVVALIGDKLETASSNRTPPRHRQRIPKHHQLHRPLPTRRRRVQTPNPLPSVKSQISHGRAGHSRRHSAPAGTCGSLQQRECLPVAPFNRP